MPPRIQLCNVTVEFRSHGYEPVLFACVQGAASNTTTVRGFTV